MAKPTAVRTTNSMMMMIAMVMLAATMVTVVMWMLGEVDVGGSVGCRWA